MITEFRRRRIITSSLRGAKRRGNPCGSAALPNAGAIRKAVWIAAGLKALAMTENIPRRKCQPLSPKCSSALCKNRSRRSGIPARHEAAKDSPALEKTAHVGQGKPTLAAYAKSIRHIPLKGSFPTGVNFR
jgi:hypothetical protein